MYIYIYCAYKYVYAVCKRCTFGSVFWWCRFGVSLFFLNIMCICIYIYMRCSRVHILTCSLRKVRIWWIRCDARKKRWPSWRRTTVKWCRCIMMLLLLKERRGGARPNSLQSCSNDDGLAGVELERRVFSYFFLVWILCIQRYERVAESCWQSGGGEGSWLLVGQYVLEHFPIQSTKIISL